jgi:aminopeptidase 2
VRDLSGVKPGEILFDRMQKRVALGLPSDWNVVPGCKLLMKVTWAADLNTSMRGYYKAAWKKNGADAYYALTQFESTEARRAYPSWDEPAVKSTYSIALVSRTDMVNLSNMPAVDEKPWMGSIELEGGALGGGISDGTKGDWVVTVFQKTPLISSYLVAWASGEFVHLESHYVSPLSGAKIPLRIYATSDNISKAQLALDVKAKAMPIYEQLFDIEYPLPKLDTLVVSEFDSGAMENWGLITGRASSLLWDPEKSSLYDKKFVIQTQCHECAHMWFGNIVSPEWWTYLWLNEAFATLMGEIIVPETIFPEFNVRQEFLTGSLAWALKLDALRSSHPTEVNCPDALLIDEFFDSIGYCKVRSWCTVTQLLIHFLSGRVGTSDVGFGCRGGYVP